MLLLLSSQYFIVNDVDCYFFELRNPLIYFVVCTIPSSLLFHTYQCADIVDDVHIATAYSFLLVLPLFLLLHVVVAILTVATIVVTVGIVSIKYYCHCC